VPVAAAMRSCVLASCVVFAVIFGPASITCLFGSSCSFFGFSFGSGGETVEESVGVLKKLNLFGSSVGRGGWCVVFTTLG